MAGEDQSETKHERVALPPPVKRRDHHMRKLVRISSIKCCSFSFSEYRTSGFCYRRGIITAECLWCWSQF